MVKYLVSERPCSSVGKATVICSGGRMFEPHRGQRFFSLSPCGSISFLGLKFRKDYLGYSYNTLTYRV